MLPSFLRNVPHLCELLLLAACFSSGESNPSSDSSTKSSDGSLQALSTDTIELTLRSDVPVRFHISDELPADFVARIAANDTTHLADIISAWDNAIPYRRGFAIADGTRILVVDSSQRVSAVIGGKGRGPGEFEFVDALCASRGDTLVAIDGSSEIEVFDEGGRFVRQLILRSADPTDECLDDGTFLGLRRVGTDSLGIERYSLTGQSISVVGIVPFAFDMGGLEVRARYSLIAKGDRVYWANPWLPEVRVYNRNGNIERLYRLAESPTRRPTGAIRKFYAAPKAGTSSAGLLPAKSAYFPYFWDIQVGDDGALWVREYPESGDIIEAPQIWTGYTVDGAPLGRLLVDPVATAEGRVQVVGIRSHGVSVRFEAEGGQVEYRVVPWARIRSN